MPKGEGLFQIDNVPFFATGVAWGDVVSASQEEGAFRFQEIVQSDLALSHMAREAVIATITTNAPVSSRPGPVSAAVALRAVLPQTTALTAREQDLLREWLDRIAASR